ncbi:MAG: phosphoglucosamine mutase [Alphaproteobacteria bacterium]|nr:phosphoglucosamine mutase [Alphaproteobacteria bacterium]
MSENKWFGTDGVRGVVGEFPMVADFATSLGKAMAKLICTKYKKVAIARDTRESGKMLEKALSDGLISGGVDVLLLGIMPTPAVTSLVSELNVDMAVMITASHNPNQYNGIKLIANTGDKLADNITARLERFIEKETVEEKNVNIGKIFEDNQVLEKYLKKVKTAVVKEKALVGMKIVVDCANGCFSNILPKVFESLGAEVIVLACSPNGENINSDSGTEHTENMCEKVVDVNADMGIAVDGDGDRIIICDNLGKRIDGDQIIAFLATYYKQHKYLLSDTVVATIVSNPALDIYLANNGIKCVRSIVGERYVIDEMKNVKANIGGEESGHIVISDYAKTGDALIAGLIFAQGVWEQKQKISNLFPLFKPIIRKRIDIKFINKNKMMKAFENDELKQKIGKWKNIIKNDSMVLVRKSGTEPKIQVWVWNDDEDLALNAVQDISAVLEKTEGFESCRKF